MSAFHRCQHCGCVTDMSNMLPIFEENPHCRQCGLSVTESDSKMQDDLADLMTRNLHLGSVQTPLHDSSMSTPSTPQVLPQPAPITYISQHYHHSTHLAPIATPEVQISTLLENAGVNASALLPSQLQLFKNAQPDQQQRLVELWRIAPVTYGSQLPSGRSENWPSTNMDQEETAARERWERQEQQRLRNLSVFPGQDNKLHAEPYMQNGYQALPNINGITAPTEYRPSTDPAYQNSREWWTRVKQEPMEHQYGMMQHMMHRTDEDDEML